MKFKKMLVVPASVALAIPLMAGCPDQAQPSSISDGTTHVTKNMLGFWHAPGGASCRWWIQTKKGVIGDPGNTVKGRNGGRIQKKGKAADQSQTMMLATVNGGDYYIKSDKCGPWKPGAA